MSKKKIRISTIQQHILLFVYFYELNHFHSPIYPLVKWMIAQENEKVKLINYSFNSEEQFPTAQIIEGFNQTFSRAIRELVANSLIIKSKFNPPNSNRGWYKSKKRCINISLGNKYLPTLYFGGANFIAGAGFGKEIIVLKITQPAVRIIEKWFIPMHLRKLEMHESDTVTLYPNEEGLGPFNANLFNIYIKGRWRYDGPDPSIREPITPDFFFQNFQEIIHYKNLSQKIIKDRYLTKQEKGFINSYIESVESEAEYYDYYYEEYNKILDDAKRRHINKLEDLGFFDYNSGRPNQEENNNENDKKSVDNDESDNYSQNDASDDLPF